VQSPELKRMLPATVNTAFRDMSYQTILRAELSFPVKYKEVYYDTNKKVGEIVS
jgi:hypothetical protein